MTATQLHSVPPSHGGSVQLSVKYHGMGLEQTGDNSYFSVCGNKLT